jgi:hypothetical protein
MGFAAESPIQATTAMQESKLTDQIIWNVQTSKPKPKQKRTNHDDAFDKRIQELKVYRDTNGHCRVPRCYERNKALGYWASNTRAHLASPASIKIGKKGVRSSIMLLICLTVHGEGGDKCSSLYKLLDLFLPFAKQRGPDDSSFRDSFPNSSTG